MAALKPESNGELYSNTVISSRYIYYNDEGTGRARALPSPLVTVPNVTALPSTASVPTLYYLMWHYNGLWALQG